MKIKPSLNESNYEKRNDRDDNLFVNDNYGKRC